MCAIFSKKIKPGLIFVRNYPVEVPFQVMENVKPHGNDLPVEYIHAVFQDPLINRHWKKIADLLGTPKPYIDKLKMDFILQKQQLDEIMQAIFIYWLLEHPLVGSVKNFMEILCNDIELGLATKNVEASVTWNDPPCQHLEWDNLDNQAKEVVLTKQIWFMGKMHSLLNICGFLEERDFSAILEKTLCSTTLTELLSCTDYEITKDSIPKPYNAYIRRHVVVKRQVDPKLFSNSHVNDVFLMKGISKSELSVLTRVQNIELSGNQRRKLTVAFIILEEEDHVDVIFKRTTKNIHLISYTEGKYFWLKSKGCISLLKQHLVNETESAGEQFLVDQFEKHDNSSICISDISGAGKSTLLANIARNVRELYPERVVIFIQMAELLPLLPKYEFTVEIFWQILARKLSCNELGYYLLLHMFLCANIFKELFVDCLGESWSEEKQSVTDFLEGISTLKNIRLCVTSQINVQCELQETLACFAYNLTPITLHEQIKFLTESWESLGTDSLKEHLEDYARSCISLLNIGDDVITGLPLLCSMLADIYASEASDYASSGKSPILDKHGKSMSIINIYRDFMKAILHTLNLEQQFSLYYLAIKSIFDTSDNLVGQCWDYQKAKQIIKQPTLGSSPQFLHRSFAEYMIAHVIATAIKGTVYAPEYSEEVMKCLPSVLKTDCYSFQETKFRETRLCYFLDVMIQLSNSNMTAGKEVDQLTNNQQHQLIFSRIVNKSEILKACIFHEFYQLLFLILSTSEEASCTVVTKKQWKKILLVATRDANLNIVRNIMQQYSLDDVREMQFKDLRRSHKNTTPLHVAIQRGNFALFEYFLDIYRAKLKCIPGLIHAAVENSEDQSSDAINVKVKIIDFLVKYVGQHLLNEALEENITPILMEKVHLTLIKKLVKEGADITSLTTNNSNVAHIVSSYMNPKDYHNFVNFLLYNGKESLLRDLNSFQESAFQIALENSSILSETISLLSTSLSKTEFKEKVYQENFVYHLVKNNYNQSALEKALKTSTSWPKLIYKDGTISLLHIAVYWGNVQATSLFIEQGSDCNAVDEDQQTPLHVACNLELSPKFEAGAISTMIDLLTDNGADVNIPDKNGYTPLSYILDQIK